MWQPCAQELKSFCGELQKLSNKTLFEPAQPQRTFNDSNNLADDAVDTHASGLFVKRTEPHL